jgi:hypothetical protein
MKSIEIEANSNCLKTERNSWSWAQKIQSWWKSQPQVYPLGTPIPEDSGRVVYFSNRIVVYPK